MWHRLGAEPTLQSFWRKTFGKYRNTSTTKITRVCLSESLIELSGSHMPPFCLQTSLKNLLRNLSLIALKVQSTCCSKNRSNFFLWYFFFFIRFDELSAAMKSNYLVLDSSCLHRTRLSLFFACLPPKTIRCLMLFFYYVLVPFLSDGSLSAFSPRDILAFEKSGPYFS